MEPFKNKNINLLNLHAGLCRFSNNIFDVFGAVYLLSLGISFPIVALAWAGSLFLRFILRPFSMLLSEKIGLRRALIIGVILGSMLFIVLTKINGINNYFYFYIFYLAICDITYWLPYHSYYATAGDEQNRGKQICVQFGFVTFLKTMAPFVGGIMITHFGFWSLYFIASIVMLLSAIPLFFAKDVLPGKIIIWKEAIQSIDKHGMIMMIGDGILYMHAFVWTIVLFYLVGNYTTFGGLVAFESLSIIVLFYFLGYFIDKGNGKRVTYIGLISIGVVILLRAFLVKTIPEIIITDVLIAFGMTFYLSSFNVGLYNMAKRSSNTLWFHFFGEVGWDIGAMISLTLSAILFSLGVPLKFIIVFALPGLFITYKILKKFYKQNTLIDLK
ncbi:MAG: MFS transporter [Candidatus Paceibacterota bacterium]|jgi:MFS family permease